MENNNTDLFEGKSSHGDIYGALENAIGQAKGELSTDLVNWTLHSVSGTYGGFVGAKDLTVSITASQFQSVGENDVQTLTEANTSEVSEGVRIPVFLSGLAAKMTGVDTCMDGATHRLETFLGHTRLKAGDEEVKTILDEASEKRVRVFIAGYPVSGPECKHIRVYSATSASKVAVLIDGGDLPRGI